MGPDRTASDRLRGCCHELEQHPEDEALIRGLKTAMSSLIREAPPVPTELIGHPRYRILDVLGSGGRGTVFKATHLLLERTVALKVIRKDLLSRPDLVERYGVRRRLRGGMASGLGATREQPAECRTPARGSSPRGRIVAR